MVHNDPLGGRAAEELQNGKQDSIILTLKPRKGSCMDNLAQTLLAALDNTKGERKISIDDAIKEAIRLEVQSAVNQIMGHELTAFLGYEKSEQDPVHRRETPHHEAFGAVENLHEAEDLLDPPPRSIAGKCLPAPFLRRAVYVGEAALCRFDPPVGRYRPGDHAHERGPGSQDPVDEVEEQFRDRSGDPFDQGV